LPRAYIVALLVSGVAFDGRDRGCLAYSNVSMSPMPGIPSLDELRRKVISELVDLEIVSARRLTRRQRLVRGIRRRSARITRLGG
jgi:hypothetical protein